MTEKNKTALKLKVKKGDQVILLTGRDKGKTGEIIRALPQENRVVVQGINVLKKHKKPTATSAGGIEAIEASVHVSNVALIDPKTQKPTRVGYKTLADGTKVRVAKKSGETIA
jgi:large subunit ribosomal protein L24